MTHGVAMACPVSLDDELVPRIRAGDEEAFDALVRRHYNGLCVFAARMTKSDATAEEIVQEVMLRIWRQHEQWSVTGSVAAYLYAAVRNMALNHSRRERLLRRWQEEVGARGDASAAMGRVPQADEGTRATELADALARAVEKLPPRCRQVFILRRQHHMSVIEVARVMQIAPKTVEIQMGIALKALRRALAHLL